MLFKRTLKNGQVYYTKGIAPFPLKIAKNVNFSILKAKRGNQKSA